MELVSVRSGLTNGALLDLIHWLLDRYVLGDPLLYKHLSLDRFGEVHRLALDSSEAHLRDRTETLPVSLLVGGVGNLNVAQGGYDLIFSNAVLEHVKAPLPTLETLTRLLAPGGKMYHVIDYRDHRSYRAPGLYPALPQPGPVERWSDPDTNGLRHADWLALFDRLSLRITACKIFDVTNAPADRASDLNGDAIAAAELTLEHASG